MAVFGDLWNRFRPLAKELIYGRALAPKGPLRQVFRAAFVADTVARETYELARRVLFATPVFLARCAVHGERIAVDRLPYINGFVRIELGSDIRISGQLDIHSLRKAGEEPLLKIGNGVFIGHDTRIAVARRVEIGDFVSIGGGSYIADTDGHARSAPGKPIWDVPASEEDIAPVVIENDVQIARNVVILKGVRIGARSVIGTGSVVRSDIPADAVAMGNPARVVKRIVPVGDKAA